MTGSTGEPMSETLAELELSLAFSERMPEASR